MLQCRFRQGIALGKQFYRESQWAEKDGRRRRTACLLTGGWAAKVVLRNPRVPHEHLCRLLFRRLAWRGDTTSWSGGGRVFLQLARATLPERSNTSMGAPDLEPGCPTQGASPSVSVPRAQHA
eukprot:CAMPEP_0167813826 /NCGR_PEP_ID=MMETSP0112_2-20121227/2070_1 /TAXON_ID=91324 /ORGANISM="Lotharella globosa, Strain CCCM811" /LENGTH=122 /DNA_ID=CAMNT_0007712953 /DNA_START=254 /DNA_END=622 /DNA_ORIENTATION=+